jgi:hypothetical protein
MPTIAEIRQQYPQYSDMSDTQLADALHSKFYADMPREQFDAKVGLTTKPAEEKPSGVMDFFKSIPRGMLKGFSTQASVGGQAAALEMSDPALAEQIPGAEQSTALLEQNVTGELPKPAGRAGRFGEAIGEVLGSPVSYVGPGSLALKMGAGALGAVGGESAGELAAGTRFETPARIAGSTLAGGGAALAPMERQLAKLAGRLPTREDIKAAATAGYNMLRQSDTRLSPEGAQTLATDIQAALHQGDFREYLEPKTFRALSELASGQHTDVGEVDTVRRLLLRAQKDPNERAAAGKAVEAIDDFLINVPEHFILSGNPAADAEILRHAQRNWALHKQLEQVEESTTKAQRRAAVSGSGANRINTTRQEIRKILDSDRKSRGLSADVKDKMEEIIEGTWLTNRARQVGKFAPSGPVSALFTVGADMSAGHGAAAAVGVTGFLSKWLGEYLTDRQLKQLEHLMRSESPIGRSVAREIEPQQTLQRMVPAAQAARSALTSPLAPGQ